MLDLPCPPTWEKRQWQYYTSTDHKHYTIAYVPLPVFTVVGLKAFHTMVSQMLVAMKREIPEPKPYPF